MTRPPLDFSFNRGGDEAFGSRSCEPCAAGDHRQCARAIGILNTDPFSPDSPAWDQDTSTLPRPPACLCFRIGHPEHPTTREDL